MNPKYLYTTLFYLFFAAKIAFAQDFRVQVGAFSTLPDTAFLRKAKNEKITYVKDQMDVHRYNGGDYNTRDEAEQVRQALIAKGFNNTIVIDLAEQRLLSGAGCPYFREGMVYIADPSQKAYVFTIYFDSGSATLGTEGKSTLDQVTQLMKNHPELKLRLMGYTDGVGNADANTKLAAERVRNARNHVQAKGRFKPEQFILKVYGEADPAAANFTYDNKDNPEGRRYNRRVVLVLVNPDGEIGPKTIAKPENKN